MRFELIYDKEIDVYKFILLHKSVGGINWIKSTNKSIYMRKSVNNTMKKSSENTQL
jgi:hypothetical protein